jgi:hypothetical protein
LKCASYCPHNQFRFDWDENNNLQRVLACNAEPEKGLREIGRTPMDDRDTEFECCIPLQLLQKTVLTALRKAQDDERSALLVLEDIALAMDEESAEAEQATEQTEEQPAEVSPASREVA